MALRMDLEWGCMAEVVMISRSIDGATTVLAQIAALESLSSLLFYL